MPQNGKDPHAARTAASDGTVTTRVSEPSDSVETDEEVTGFFGAYNHSIDTKGRMIIPQAFREKLGERIIVGVNISQTSIAVYPLKVWKDKLNMLASLAREDVSAEVFLERFSMLSFDSCGFDAQGRILLPAALRELFIKDAPGVQVSGAREYVRVVSSVQAAGETEMFTRKHADVLADISAIQARLREVASKH